MRAEESGGSECRPVMGRIGVEEVERRRHPTRKRADFRTVLLHENNRDASTESCAEERLRTHARSGSTFEWRDTNWSDCHRRVRSLQTRIVKAWQMSQGESLAAAAHPFAERQGFGREASDGEPRQMDAGSGRSNLVYTRHQIRSSVIAQETRLPAAPTETGIHPEEQRQDATARDSDDEGPCDAGSPSARAGTNRGMYGGPQLLWIPDETVGTGRDDGMSNPVQPAAFGPMDIGG